MEEKEEKTINIGGVETRITKKSVSQILPSSEQVLLSKELDKENIIKDLEDRIVSILNSKRIDIIQRKALVSYLKKLSTYFQISIDYIRFLLLFEVFGNYREAVEHSRSNYGRSKVSKIIIRLRNALKKEGIGLKKETREFKRRRLTGLGVDKWRETQELTFLML